MDSNSPHLGQNISQNAKFQRNQNFEPSNTSAVFITISNCACIIVMYASTLNDPLNRNQRNQLAQFHNPYYQRSRQENWAFSQKFAGCSQRSHISSKPLSCLFFLHQRLYHRLYTCRSSCNKTIVVLHALLIFFVCANRCIEKSCFAPELLK